MWLVGNENIGGRESPDLSVLDFISGTDYTGGYDVLGRLTFYRYVTPQYTHTYTTTYEGRESWLQKTVTGTSTNSSYRTTTNTLSYNAFGRLMSQRETTPLKSGSIDDRMRYYASDAEGKVVNRREGLLTSNGTFSQEGMAGPANYRLVHANGQQIAELREGYQGVFLNKPYNTLQIQSLAGRGGYDAGGGQTVAQAGDTLRTIAQRVYGTDQMWYVLADANGFGDADAEIGAGTRINTPEASVNSNNANTFKPYDPTAAIGSTTPGLPYIPPPPPQKCQGLSKVIAIVVQVVVTAVVAYYSGNAEAAYAAGAAAGNHAGQVSAAMLNGQYDWSRWSSMTANPFQGNANDAATTVFDPIGHGMPGQIDYKSIGVSAAAAYTAAYVGGTNPYVYSATSSAASYQYAKWAGYDVSWSNRDLAKNLAAVTISQGINQSGMFSSDARVGLDGNTTVAARTDGAGGFSWTSVASNTARNFVAGAVTYGVGKALGSSEHWNTVDMLTDAFGNALGSEIASPYDQARLAQEKGREAGRQMQGINAELSERNEQTLQSLVDGFQTIVPDVSERSVAMRQKAAEEPTSGNTRTPLRAPRSSTSLGHQSADVVAVIDELYAGPITTLEAVKVSGANWQGLDLDDLAGILGQVGNEARLSVDAGVRLFDRDALNYQWGFGGRVRVGAEYEAREALRARLSEADANSGGNAQLVMLAPEGMSDYNKLVNAVRAGGGYMTEEVGQNLLDQVNSGADAIDLTYARVQSESALAALMSTPEFRTRAYASETNGNLLAKLGTISSGAVAKATDHYLASDSLLPGRITISELGVQREVNRALALATTVGGIADLAALPILLTRGAAGKIPFGFGSRSSFSDFSASLHSGLGAAGYRNVDAAFQGSSVTGRAYVAPHAPFDVGRVSDFDIALSSPELFQRAQDLGIGLRQQGVRTGPLKSSDLKRLELFELRESLSRKAGRPVNFMLFRSIDDATVRSPSILVPRKP
jgi:hypothetical protein